MARNDGRQSDDVRPVEITVNVNKYAEGSVLIACGDTKVLCTATIEDRVPPFMKGQGRGWITAEYSMLPRATQSRNQRESARGKLGGRTMEIQRLIGRALRSVVDLKALGERSITLDCDVLQADGGTRTTAITGAFVAMVMALQTLVDKQQIKSLPVGHLLASISVGIVDQQCLVDLNYIEDSRAKVDMNVVMTGAGEFVEIQGTGESAPFSRQEADELLSMAEAGIRAMLDKQREALGSLASDIENME